MLNIENLTVAFDSRRGRLTAVKGVSLSVERGEILGVVGESGAGKSTIGAAVMGLLESGGSVQGGEIEFEGQNLLNLDDEAMRSLRGRKIGMIFQDPMTALNPVRTIGDQLSETIAHALSLDADSSRKSALQWLHKMDIPNPETRIDHYPHEFSGGQRQRLVIALALCGEPDLVIADEEDRARVRAELGFDRPILVQFGQFLGNFVSGDLGKSLRTNEYVSDLLSARLPATLELVFLAALMTLALGIWLGIFTGVHRRGKRTQAILSSSLLGVSIPTFLLGLLAIYFGSVQLGLFPAAGRKTIDIGLWETSLLSFEGLRSIFMPALTLTIFNVGLFIRLVRAEVLEIRTTDYIKFARARGLPEDRINRRHVLPNAVMPVINVAALNIGIMLAFSLITEAVFQWPGVGLMFLQSIRFSDFPVMSSYFMLVAVIFVGLNLIADILLAVVDPRIRRGENK